MKTVITYGSFDLFHEGHYRLLERAKKLGGYLIVGVTTEMYDESRGKLNIIDSLVQRIENVKKTGFPDKIIIEDHKGQKIEDVQKYKVDIFAIGSDWTGKFDYLKEFCDVVYLPRTKGISSTLKRSKAFKTIRMGLIGNGRIAGRHVKESKYVSGINIEGVYNPKLESAKKFAEEFELAFFSNNLQEFFSKIDAVIIASPHGTHYEYAKKALESGVHVLCEKPMALNENEVREIFKIAKEKKLVLMEAIKTAYAPGFQRLIGIAKSGLIGKVKDVEACFTRITPSEYRELSDVKFGGSLNEFGSYTILPIIKILGTKIDNVRFETIKNDLGVDVYTKVYFSYEDSMGLSKTGLKVKSEGELIIAGTNGYIKVKAPWWKTKEFEICYEDIEKNEKIYTQFLEDGLRYEQSDFVSMVNGCKDNSFKLTEDESACIAKVMGLFLNEKEKNFI